MSRKSSNAGIVLLLVFCCLALGAVIAFEWLNPPVLPKSTVSVAPELPVTENQVSQQLIGIAARDEYQEIIERPLFLESRRPPPPEPETPPEPIVEAPPVEEETLILQGVILITGAEMALLQIEETGKVVRLRVGEDVNDWTLQSIAANSITLSKEGEAVKKLSLVRNRKPPVKKPVTKREKLRNLRQKRLQARANARAANKRATNAQVKPEKQN